MTTVAEIQKQIEYKMSRSVDALREDLSKLRTGRASTGLLEHVMVAVLRFPDPFDAGG